MAKQKKSVTRKVFEVGGWQAAKRVAKMVPFGGTVIVVGLVGYDIKKKGVVRGVINSGLDAVPFVGIGKNLVEFFVGDFIPDKDARKKKNS